MLRCEIFDDLEAVVERSAVPDMTRTKPYESQTLVFGESLRLPHKGFEAMFSPVGQVSVQPNT